MVTAYERVYPLYTIRAYENLLFRVSKRLCGSGSGKGLSYQEKMDLAPLSLKTSEDGKFWSALCRAKTTVRDVALCNKWDYFVTLTFNRLWWDRYDLQERCREFFQWIQNQNKKGSNIRYLLVPEFHEDGAVHFHGFISGIKSAPQLPGTPVSVGKKSDGSRYECWPEYSLRYGFSTLEPIRDPIAVGFYVSKYITKTLARSASGVGVHTYYLSKGLDRSSVVGEVYHENWALDKICKFQSPYYNIGFCKFSDVGDAVDFCDEVNSMYQNYVVTDPVTEEIVSMFGGDDDDPFVQEILEAFRQQDFCVSPWGNGD